MDKSMTTDAQIFRRNFGLNNNLNRTKLTSSFAKVNSFKQAKEIRDLEKESNQIKSSSIFDSETVRIKIDTLDIKIEQSIHEKRISDEEEIDYQINKKDKALEEELYSELNKKDEEIKENADNKDLDGNSKKKKPIKDLEGIVRENDFMNVIRSTDLLSIVTYTDKIGEDSINDNDIVKKIDDVEVKVQSNTEINEDVNKLSDGLNIYDKNKLIFEQIKNEDERDINEFKF